MNSTREQIDRLAELLGESKRIVVFTGAGISTESGIPDFRSPGGVWSRMKPIEFADFVKSPEMRRESWRRRFSGDDRIQGAEPNEGHMAVARLAELGRVSAVVTQNVDGLHQKSGIADELVIELHGNATYAKCLACSKRFELEPLREAFLAGGDVPDCDACGGLIKTATISFGQAMPEEAMQQAGDKSLACDLFLVLGSSLVVFPAADFPLYAKRRGARLVIINREATHLDELCDLSIHAELGKTLGAAVFGR